MPVRRGRHRSGTSGAGSSRDRMGTARRKRSRSVRFRRSSSMNDVTTGRSVGTRLGFPDTPIELILARQVASYLTLAIILTDADGDLVFYNEPAEELLGLRFDHTGPLPLSDRVAALTL